MSDLRDHIEEKHVPNGEEAKKGDQSPLKSPTRRSATITVDTLVDGTSS